MDPWHRRTPGGVPVGLTGGIGFVKSDSPGKASRDGSGGRTGFICADRAKARCRFNVRMLRRVYWQTFVYSGMNAVIEYVSCTKGKKTVRTLKSPEKRTDKGLFKKSACIMVWDCF